MKTKYSHLFIALVTLLSAMTIHSCGENEIIVPNKTEEDTKLEIDSVSSHFKFEYTYIKHSQGADSKERHHTGCFYRKRSVSTRPYVCG